MSVEATNWAWKHSRSRGPARLVLLALADYANDQHQAWPAMKTLTAKTALGERTVHRAIAQLIKMGELRIEYNAGPRLCNLYQVLLTPAPEAPPSERHPRQNGTPVDVSPPSEGPQTPARDGVKGVPERHPEPSIEPSRNRQEPQTPVEQARPIDDTTHLFQVWQDTTGKHKAKLDPKRRRVITTALKHYTVPELEDAIRGVLLSPFHCGQNDTGTVHHELTLILRDSAHIERFRDLTRDGPTPVMGRQTTKALRIAQEMHAMGQEGVMNGGLGPVERDRGRAQHQLPASGD